MEREPRIRYSQNHSRDMQREGRVLDLLIELKEATGKDWACDVDEKGILTFKPVILSPTPPEGIHGDVLGG